MQKMLVAPCLDQRIQDGLQGGLEPVHRRRMKDLLVRGTRQLAKANLGAEDDKGETEVLRAFENVRRNFSDPLHQLQTQRPNTGLGESANIGVAGGGADAGQLKAGAQQQFST